jgi:hypothetical protein
MAMSNLVINEFAQARLEEHFGKALIAIGEVDLTGIHIGYKLQQDLAKETKAYLITGIFLILNVYNF